MESPCDDRPRTSRGGILIATSLALVAIAFLAASPIFAFEDLEVGLDPIQPLPGQDFVLSIEGMSNTLPVTVESFARDGQALDVVLHRPPCLDEFCSARPFRVEIPIDGSSDPFEAGLVDLDVDGRVSAQASTSVLIRSTFAIGNIYFHSMQPEIYIDPREPTDNDRVQILVPVQANTCGPGIPRFDRVERQGSRVLVFFRFSPGFGGDFLTGGPVDPTVAPSVDPSVDPVVDPKCTPAIPFLGATAAELGIFEEGNYSVDLFLQVDREGSFPIRVRRRDFTVADAPDVATLQDGRFLVELEWTDFDGNSGVGRPVPGPTSDSTLFTFFGRENWEVLVKVLDGCAINDRYWVFGAAATDVEYVLTVTDIDSNQVWTRTNPLGSASEAITDIDAFDSCP